MIWITYLIYIVGALVVGTITDRTGAIICLLCYILFELIKLGAKR